MRETMSDATAQLPEKPEKKKKSPLILGLVLAVAGAGAGYYAVTAGLVPLPGHAPPETHVETLEPLPEIAFVEIDPIMISLNNAEGIQHLRFRAQLEVEAAHREDVQLILPRVVDVLNGYLRALELDDLRDAQSLTRLRAQMLRRAQIVAGQGRVRDLLIMEFVLD